METQTVVLKSTAKRPDGLTEFQYVAWRGYASNAVKQEITNALNYECKDLVEQVKDKRVHMKGIRQELENPETKNQRRPKLVNKLLDIEKEVKDLRADQRKRLEPFIMEKTERTLHTRISRYIFNHKLPDMLEASGAKIVPDHHVDKTILLQAKKK